MTSGLPACVAATHRRPMPIVLRETLHAALLGLSGAWMLAELALLLEGH